MRRGPLPLVVGVTGHRDLREADRPALAVTVRRLLDDLLARYPATPLIVLSPLAEGADRLVGRVALEAGVRLVVPLPMERALFERDFPATAARAEFADLLARAESWFELPLAPGVTPSDVAGAGPMRDRQYARAGAFVGRHSHLLVALWDGAPATPEQAGGTASVVRARLEGDVADDGSPGALLDPPDHGPVFQVVTPRASDPPAGAPYALVVHAPSAPPGSPPGPIHETIWARVDAFNRDAVERADRLAPLRERSRRELASPDEAAALPPALRDLREAFAVADALSIYFQQRTVRTLRWIFLCVLAAAACFAVFDDLVFGGPWPRAGLYIASLGFAGGARLVWRRARRQDAQNRHQDYRALAEGLRVAFFWRLAGIDLPVAANYLRKQRGELEWIRSAILAWSLPGAGAAPCVAAPPPDRATGLHAVLRRWVTGQAAYFQAAARRDESRRARLHGWARGALRLGAAFSGLLLLLVVGGLLAGSGWGERLGLAPLAADAPGGPYERVRGLLLVLLALSAVVAALLHNFSEKGALSEHARQYARMGLLFAEAERRLTGRLDRLDEARALLAELGREALAENGDWLLLHRDRPLEVPEG
jgi:hypothetical protein